MPSINLIELLKQEEGKTLEFKRDLSSPDKLLQTIVAFANTAGGVLVIGVENQTKHIRGIADPLKEEERLASLITDRIDPLLVPSIEIVAHRSAQVLVVEIFPSQNRPHCIKNLGVEKGVLVRIGSTNRRADAPLIADMRRFVRNETHDESALPHLNSEALDFRAASELFPGRRTTGAPALETLRALARHERRLVPTVGGLLLFGKNHESEFPDAWVQCGRFAGTDKSAIADSAECRGNLPRLVELAYAFVQKHTMRPIQIGGGLKRTELPGLPLRAMRELLVNAIVHTDYSQQGAPIRVSLFDDRVEIENPGVLLAGLTIDDIKQGVSKLRNRVIGRVFKELGYIEQWGSGIQRVIADCRQAGLSEPIFEERAFRFRVTISLKTESQTATDPVTALIRDALATSADGGLSTRELAGHAGITSRAMRARLSKLVDCGLVVAVGKTLRDPHRKYFWRKP